MRRARVLALVDQDVIETAVELGRDGDPSFNMTIFSLRLSDWRNAVSKLHGKVSRRMWQRLWPELGEDNKTVYCELLGYTPDRLRELEDQGVV